MKITHRDIFSVPSPDNTGTRSNWHPPKLAPARKVVAAALRKTLLIALDDPKCPSPLDCAPRFVACISATGKDVAYKGTEVADGIEHCDPRFHFQVRHRYSGTAMGKTALARRAIFSRPWIWVMKVEAKVAGVMFLDRSLYPVISGREFFYLLRGFRMCWPVDVTAIVAHNTNPVLSAG